MEIKTGEIYSFKLTSGQEIVAKVKEIRSDGWLLDHPLSIGQGQKGMEFIPVSFTGTFGADGILQTIAVALILPAREDIIESYERSIDPSEIVTPPPKQIITG